METVYLETTFIS
jgi:hypothetical protein